MREELVRILSTYTALEVRDAVKADSDAKLITAKCCEVLLLAFAKKFNPFLSYLQLNQKFNSTDTETIVDNDTITIKSKLSAENSLAALLRRTLNNYLDNFTISEFRNEFKREDLTALELLCITMLSAQANPAVVLKLLQIFDLLEDEITFKIKSFTTKEG